MNDEYYAPLPSKNAYLERLGVTGALTPDLETLNRLILGHLRQVPFENLDVFDAGAEIRLDIPSLFDKIVTRRRGGYCFELNGLFYALLREIGYNVYPIAVRVVWMSEDRTDRRAMLSHRAAVVTLGSDRYFCDVGFGGPAPHSALRLDDPSAQASVGSVFDKQTFVFDKSGGDTVLCRLTPSGRERLLQFSEVPFDPVDFLAMSEYQSQNKNSGFKKVRMVNLATETGSVSLTGSALTVRENGVAEETALRTEEELRSALKHYFGLETDFPLKI